MSLEQIRVGRDGNRIKVISKGRLILDVPHEAALEIGRAIIGKAKEAEELANPRQIIMDQAILFRSGFPLGLTNNRDIMSESIKTAMHDRDLRRFMPGGVRSQAVVGTPSLIQKEP